jgi:hypothetical protein
MSVKTMDDTDENGGEEAQSMRSNPEVCQKLSKRFTRVKRVTALEVLKAKQRKVLQISAGAPVADAVNLTVGSMVSCGVVYDDNKVRRKTLAGLT